ncbi:MAG: DmsE family decaheme c-type cytochrome, partial [Acidobacteriota bacterium]
YACAQTAAAPLAKAAYVGSEVCRQCHEDIGSALAKTPHEAVEKSDRHGFTGKACEACHGPGSRHAESISPADIRNPARLPASEVDRTCMTCHRNQPSQAGRIESGHARSQIACTACHSIHGNRPEALVARKTVQINTLCATCHQSEMSAFQLPFRHRVPEGAMSCVDCHNPHGSFKPGLMQLASANEPGCFKCHGDKRGPFTFEHAPVRFEGCSGCHQPHGAANPKMLIRQEVRLVCLECHASLPALPNTTAAVSGVVPPAFHDLTSPRFRNCTICHQKIHGSYVDRNLLR